MNNQVKYELLHESNATLILPNEEQLIRNGRFAIPFNEAWLAHFSPYISYCNWGIPHLPDWRPDKFRQPRYFVFKPTHFICEFLSEDNPTNKDFHYPEFRKAKTISGSFHDEIILVGKYVFERVLDKQEKKHYNKENLSDKSFQKKMEAMFNKSKK
jgi:hypothetical protein